MNRPAAHPCFRGPVTDKAKSSSALLESVLEFTARAELRHGHRRNLDFLARLGVAARARLALGLGEGAKADEGDVFTLLDALLDRVETGVQNRLGVHLGRPRRLR